MTPQSEQPGPQGSSGQYELIRRFWRDFLRPMWGGLALVAVLMIASVMLQLPSPLLTMYIVDHALGSASAGRITELSLLFAGLILVRAALSYLSETATLRLKERIILDVQMRLIGHLHRLPLAFFASQHSTYLQSRVMSDARAVEGVLVRTIVTVFVNGLTFLVGVGFVFYVEPKLALMLLLFLLPFAAIRYQTNTRMRDLGREMQERQARTSAIVAEGFSGIRTVKGYAREAGQDGIVRGYLDKLRDIYIRTNWFAIVANVGTGTVNTLCTAFVLWYGATSVLDRTMTVGQVVAVLSFLNFLYSPITTMVAANLSIQQSTSAVQRIYEFLNRSAEATAGAAPAGGVKGRIELDAVSFAYPGGKQALCGVSFAIEPGRTVALVGPSGAGKSTIVNLIARFYETDHGAVRLDGEDVRSLDLAALRGAIGLVDQQPFLFSGTIADNIRIGRPGAAMAEIIDASRKSFAHDFIQALPHGYETLVGERGARLSGGECQRIALARMFLKDPRVLILDEAVSAIDSASERSIQQALLPLIQNRTTIIIAHRLSSLLLAEEVLLIEGGQLVERGTHAALMQADGAYARLFHEQFQPQLDKADVAAVPASKVA